MQEERDRVAKSRSAMKKSLRSSVKTLRDMLNQKQNELMEVIREEEETKLKHVAQMTGSLVHVRKELADASKSLNVVAQVTKDCPYVLESANALDSCATTMETTLRDIDKHIAMLPQVAAFKFQLNDTGLREGIANLTLRPAV
jgi:Sec-independent protein translocase protein TatA